MIDVKAIPSIEFAAPEKSYYDELFERMGFQKSTTLGLGNIFQQNDITFIAYYLENFCRKFYQEHGPSVPSFSFLVDNPEEALKEAVKLGCTDISFPLSVLAIQGVGGSRILLEKNIITFFRSGEFYRWYGFNVDHSLTSLSTFFFFSRKSA